jgi:uncharacterized membrane protein YkvI
VSFEVNAELSADTSSWFQRFLLPGFAFKAVIIGGGYATGRELAEFFLPSGPWGGLAAMVLSMLIWSAVAALTFAMAQQLGTYDYRSFFKALLGRGWLVFEIAYVLFIILILSVFGAAAGAIGAALFGLPPLVGTLALAVCIAGFAAFGNVSVERLFKYVSFLLYGMYGLFLLLAQSSFGGRISTAFSSTFSGTDAAQNGAGWAMGGISYAGYNIVGAVVILPVLRHLTSRRDAIVSGLIAGPLAMAPAVLFFICMAAFYPAIGAEALPSDFLLQQMHLPLFHVAFQAMIFAALLESGTGAVHAINERIAAFWRTRNGGAGVDLGPRARGMLAVGLLIVCLFVAQRFGLVALIANGYRALSYVLIAIYVLPLLTVGVYRLMRTRQPQLRSELA